MSISIDVSNKVVLVIGGTSGINRGVAELYAKYGAKVAVASRAQEKADDTVASLKSLGAEAIGFSADVRDVEALEAGVKKVHEQFGDFDVVISGAAGNFPATGCAAHNRLQNEFRQYGDNHASKTRTGFQHGSVAQLRLTVPKYQNQSVQALRRYRRLNCLHAYLRERRRNQMHMLENSG